MQLISETSRHYLSGLLLIAVLPGRSARLVLSWILFESKHTVSLPAC
jgi:hypothetical protein